jgi:maltose alpha-D-glucosyltransferase / alpha-amylase
MDEQQFRFDDKLHWFKDAIIYELHIKAFMDGDGDGIGDFKGLLQKLDYLKELGVTAVWVLPFYPSPLRDDGYDIADYYSINPSYGNIDHFKQLLVEAHKRNLKVITELVINHTSDQHPWFQRARKAPKGSVERDYYVWSDDPAKYKDVRIIFQDFETSNWTWDSVAQQYYWHRFFSHQPDLNYDNPVVQEEVFRMIDYWCSLGVDGFRLDAVPYLFERENTNGENLPETHVYLKKLRQHVDERFPGTVFLAEANMWPEDSASYFGNGDECHMNYHFPVMPRMFMALQMEDRYPITDIFEQTPDIPANCQWAIFLRNHDELTLEMVTDEERDYMYKVYVKDPKARINLGIRHRLAPLMDNNRNKIELMNVLLFSLSGTPVIYYGDEIGMGDNYYLGDRDGVRTPMQWNGDRNAGFSTANPQQLYLPLILDPEYYYESVNVANQKKNPSSLLWFMINIIRMRKNYKAFGRGDMKFVNVENPKILAFTRTYEDETILVITNLSRYAQAAHLDLQNFRNHVPVEVFSRNNFPVIRENQPYLITLAPYGYYWFRLEPISRSVFEKKTYELRVKHWEQLDEQNIEELLRHVLPEYLNGAKWFEGKRRKIRSISVVRQHQLTLEETAATLLFISVLFETGVTDLYQLPLKFVEEKHGLGILENSPQAIICSVSSGEKRGLLCDAHFTSEYQYALLYHFARNKNISGTDFEIHFSGTKEVSHYYFDHHDIRSRILPVDDPNTSIGYDNYLFLKMYRHVDRTINPDEEITRFLTETVNFPQVPDYFGSIEYYSGKDRIVLGMMQEQVEYHGNGRTYMLERLRNYHERISAREAHPVLDLKGSLVNPTAFEELSDELKEFIGATVAEGMRLLGTRTGEMHKALSSATHSKDFAPEEFSLHYQRSLYAGMQTLVRTALTNKSAQIERLPHQYRGEAESVMLGKDDVLSRLKNIYQRKLDINKIRIHGNYDLKQILFTGKDLAILDFHGDPTRSYSERRLKRSPLVDVAAMLRSIYYVAYEGLILNKDNMEDEQKLLPFVNAWIHYVSGFFLHSYFGVVKGTSLLPVNAAETDLLITYYLYEKWLYSLNYELTYRPEWAIVPVRAITELSGRVKQKEAVI